MSTRTSDETWQDYAWRLERELAAALAEVAREKARADKWQQWQEDTRQGGQILAREHDESKAALTLAQERVRVLREVLITLKRSPMITRASSSCPHTEEGAKQFIGKALSATAPAQPDETQEHT